MDEKVRKIAAVFESVLGDAADELARECGVVKRERKLTGSLLVQILVWSWWRNPQATWEDMADNALRWFGLKISPQALNDRAEMPVVEMLERLCERTLQMAVEAEPDAVPVLSRFTSVEVHDATTISLPRDLCETYPGCGNQHNSQAAALKAVVRMNVLNGRISALQFGAGKQADTKLGPALPPPPAGSLSMSDRGFFDVNELKRCADADAFFLVRPTTGACVAPVATGADAELRELAVWLQSQRADVLEIDEPVEITNARFACRLIAVRCPEQVSNERRRKLRAECKRKNRTPSRNQLVMCDWFVLITNLPPERLSVEEARVVYRVRWQIELLFKCYKSDGGLDKSRARSGPSRLVELMAKWLARLLEHTLLSPTGGPLAPTSWRARVRRAAGWVGDFARTLREGAPFLEVVQQTLTHLARLRPKAKRKTKPGTLDLLKDPALLDVCLT